MEAAARSLPPVLQKIGSPPLEIHFLSGSKFWYQTCFCVWSMQRTSPVALRPVLYNDGTLSEEQAASIRVLFPQISLTPYEEIEARLDQFLPRGRYGSLRERRLVYPHLRKLTDIHAGTCGWKLVLDSDMLFFREPTFLLNWLRAPDLPCHMLDVASCYGYPPELLEELAGTPLPQRLNVGVCGMQSDAIDWDRLEFWCRNLILRAGSHYLLEQALTAMMLAGVACRVAPEKDYVALPSRAEAQRPGAVLHHYVAESKAWYFRYAWRQALMLDKCMS
jgi:hypothetical protein